MLRKIRRKIETFSHLGSLVKGISIQSRIDLLNYSVLNNKEMGITEEKFVEENIIVSLTTYGKRLKQVYLTIESIMLQSVKPNKIVLWLDHSFNGKRLPGFLYKQMDRGLEIKFCDDLRSYKKLIPALSEYPNDIIITIDDDLLYNPNLLENLIYEYINNKKTILFSRGHKIKLLKNNEIAPYNKWEKCINYLNLSTLNFPTTGGGTLFSKRFFNEEVFNETIFMDICPTADDIWFKAMSLQNGVMCKKVETISPKGEEYIENTEMQDIGLHRTNITKGANDIQIKAVFDKYNLYDRLSL